MDDYSNDLSYYDVIEGSPDDIFPEWLFNPTFNNFENDDYYSRSFTDDALTTKVKRLKRRYNDYFEWDDAMIVYEEYMKSMINKYGSMKVIKNSLEIGTMPDFIPSKPKLKNSKKNRQFLQAGIVPSRRITDIPVDDEKMFVIARQTFPNQMGDDVDESNMFKKPTKKEARKLKDLQEKIDRKNRKANMYRVTGNSRGADFIVEYLNQAKRGVYNSSGHRKYDDDDENYSLAEIAEELERIERTPQWILDEEEKSKTVYAHGRIVKRKDIEQLDVYKYLYEEGYKVLGASNLDKKSVKMIRSQIGATEPLTKKEMKKLKKRNKKDRERIARRSDDNNALSELLLKNKIRDENNNLSMRLRDLFPD